MYPTGLQENPGKFSSDSGDRALTDDGDGHGDNSASPGTPAQ